MDTHQIGTRIELLTRSHRYAGLVNTRGYRLADVLNDFSSSIMEMEDVLAASQGAQPAELRSPHLLLRKQDVLAAFLAGEHEAPLRRNNKRIERRLHSALVMLPGLMLSGTVHLPSRITADAFLASNSLLPSFLALTDITIHSCEFRLGDALYEVAIVRREWIEALELSGELVHQ